jgi:hypothetical protein
MNTGIKREYPAMVNVGLATKAMLENVVRQFPDKHFTCTRGEICWKVRDTDGVEVLSAARLRADTWHMRAREGLIGKRAST